MARLESVRVALPFASTGALPRLAALSVKTTLPVGFAPVPVTDAVKVTAEPKPGERGRGGAGVERIAGKDGGEGVGALGERGRGVDGDSLRVERSGAEHDAAVEEVDGAGGRASVAGDGGGQVDGGAVG